MLEFRKLCKQYEGKPLLRDVSFAVGAGETLCLLGPSGSGKTTLLRIAAGLESADSGAILWDGQDLSATPVHHRGFGLMFQDYALFPHLTVGGNVAFGLRMQGTAGRRLEAAVDAALEQVNLQGWENRRTDTLSGGEQQRVALARTLATQPRLLMLDEPLAALDRSLREELAVFLRGLLRRLGIPALYVTHDQEEAFAIGTRIAILHDGRIVQAGSAADILAWPASRWVAKFLGLGNLLPASVIRTKPLLVETPLGRFQADSQKAKALPGSAGWLLLRPGDGRLREVQVGSHPTITGRVVDCTIRRDGCRVVMRCRSDGEFVFETRDPLKLGSRVIWEPSRGVFLPEDANE